MNHKIIFLCLCLITIGCVSTPVSEINSLANSAKGLTESVQNGLNLADETHNDAQALRVSLSTSEGIDDQKKFLNEESITVRIQIFRFVEEYTELLQRLASDEPIKKVDEAFGKAYAAAQKVLKNENLQSGLSFDKSFIGSNELRILTSALKQISKWIIEYKRKKALIEIVKKTDPELEKLTLVIEKDFMETEGIDKGIRAKLKGNLESLQEKIIFQFTQAKATGDLNRAIILAKEYKTIEDRIGIADKMMDSISKSVGKIRDAHKNLLQRLEEDENFSFAQTVGQLRSEVEDIRSYYESLKEKKETK